MVSCSGFGGMPAPEKFADKPPLMFTGIQILEPRIFDYIPRGVFSHSTTDVYPQAIAAGERVAVHVASGRWLELSTIQRYLDISLLLLSEKGDSTQPGERVAGLRRTRKLCSPCCGTTLSLKPGARVSRAILG